MLYLNNLAHYLILSTLSICIACDDSRMTEQSDLDQGMAIKRDKAVTITEEELGDAMSGVEAGTQMLGGSQHAGTMVAGHDNGGQDGGNSMAGETAGGNSMAGETAGGNSMAGDMAGDTAGDTAGETAGETAGDTAGETAGDTAGDSNQPNICPTLGSIETQTQIIDLNQDPLENGDEVQIQIQITPSVVDPNVPIALVLDYTNFNLDTSTLQLDGQPIMPHADAARMLTVHLPSLSSYTLTLRSTVLGDNEPLILSTQLYTQDLNCLLEGSASASLSQKIGGGGKTPICFDLAHYRSIQIAPQIERRNTDDYERLNGLREDLSIQDFIFCPESPKIIHQVEFCVENTQALDVSLHGTQDDGYWEVDDFLLAELFDGQVLINDAVTAQTHPGGNTFYCSSLDELMCTSECTSQVYADQRAITSLGVVSSVGDRARQFQDGELSLSSIFPDEYDRFQLRITMLDIGIEGRLSSPLFLKTFPQ